MGHSEFEVKVSHTIFKEQVWVSLTGKCRCGQGIEMHFPWTKSNGNEVTFQCCLCETRHAVKIDMEVMK